MHEQHWDDLRIVLAVSRARSFGDAARLLDVNESTVMRKLDRAEQRMRARLFERKQGKVTPTEAGQKLIARAQRVEEIILDATNAIQDADSRIAGIVRLSSVPMLVNHLLIPSLPALVSQHTHLELELVAEPRILSLGRREADIALRLARPIDGVRAVARKVGELRYAAYAPCDTEPAPLPWLTYEAGMSDLPPAQWISRLTGGGSGSQSRVRVNDSEGLVACARAGLGKTLLPRCIGDQMAGLVRLDEQECDLVREMWLVVHPDLRKLDRVRAVMDWVVALCADAAPCERVHFPLRAVPSNQGHLCR